LQANLELLKTKEGLLGTIVMYHGRKFQRNDWNSEETKDIDEDSTQEDDDYGCAFDRTDESNEKM
jgi:hypothetical protein